MRGVLPPFHSAALKPDLGPRAVAISRAQFEVFHVKFHSPPWPDAES